jgi:hypothetical protein
MRKSLKRVLDRLRTATGRLGEPTSMRRGLQVPQRTQALSSSTGTRRAR